MQSQVTHETFSERAERWRRDAPLRAEQRAQRGRLRRLRDAIVALGLIATLLVVAIVAGLLLVAFAVTAWKAILGFALVVALIVGADNEFRKRQS